MFKAGEKVIHHRFGEGMLFENKLDIHGDYPLKFENEKFSLKVTLSGRENIHDLYPSIYYVPQTLDMSKPEPKIGTWGYFWDDGEVEVCTFSKLTRIAELIDNCKNKYIITDREDEYMFQHFSPEIPSHIKKLMDKTNNEKS